MLTQEQFIRNFSVMANGEVDFFLGAGASIASGIPTGGDLIWEFKRTLYCSECGISTEKYKDLALPFTRKMLQEYFDRKGGYPEQYAPEEYSFYFEQCYIDPLARKRFIESIVSARKPSIGYDARSMMTELREQYYHSAPVNTLRRVVIHKTTPFIREEITGIMQAFSGIEVELVQIQDYCSWRGIRFGADPGKTAYGFPVKRGMAVKLDRDSFLLWTHGCVIHPELSGPHNYYKSSRGIPAPLLVRRFAGNASGDTLAKEILMLTKMNWNSGDSLYKTLPVTLDFAKVLARMSKQEEAIFDKAYDFRFFM